MAGKGFTVKKDWDNPRENAMPEGVRVPAEVRIGPVVVAPATVLAPMAGVTDTVFRRFIRGLSRGKAEFYKSQNIDDQQAPYNGTHDLPLHSNRRFITIPVITRRSIYHFLQSGFNCLYIQYRHTFFKKPI